MEVEQLLSLSGPALAQAVSALLETPGLYVFSDILELPNVREVSVLYFCIFSISGLFVRVLFLVWNIKKISLNPSSERAPFQPVGLLR